jgi:CRP-like cAMP-binding protein
MAEIEKDVQEFDTGEEIFHEGEHGRYMCVLVSGAVSLNRKTDKGEKMLQIINTPNDFFGETGLLTGRARGVTALAIKPSKVLVIDDKNFERIVLTNGRFALKIIRSLSQKFRDEASST